MVIVTPRGIQSRNKKEGEISDRMFHVAILHTPLSLDTENNAF